MKSYNNPTLKIIKFTPLDLITVSFENDPYAIEPDNWTKDPIEIA